MKKLRWDPIAKEQITEIFHFYKTLCGLRTAKKITDAIRQSSKRLKEQPLLGFREPLLLNRHYFYKKVTILLLFPAFHLVYVIFIH
ncbi:type II toxin-antitoxin system RelE/ParE family toxin [Parabacteroides sp. AM58-2XD]|uniref:type II toxin-antitoxin system RelE/ParE family toxin n=1 Tax=Parabacteroides TaxID=375288 RepID=UPI000FE24152|nr:type II toxin-antitoxin system RelE/ParE family toxin [Parabacteroides sp. AM58-2XD]